MPGVDVVADTLEDLCDGASDITLFIYRAGNNGIRKAISEELVENYLKLIHRTMCKKKENIYSNFRRTPQD